MAEIRGVEVFRSGVWNGDSYNVNDLDSMVDSFDRVGFRPPLKLGHDDTIGGRAWGWIANLRRSGDRLLADFVDVPDKLFKLIRDRAFDSVSSEIFWNLERAGKTFRRVLKSVALLGAEIPAVDLVPLSETVFEIEDDFHSVIFRETWFPPKRKESKSEVEKMSSTKDPSMAMDAAVRAYATDNDISYMQALDAVSSDPRNSELIEAYANDPGTPCQLSGFASESPVIAPEITGQDFHEQIVAYKDKNGCSYSEAMLKLSGSDAAKQYAEI